MTMTCLMGTVPQEHCSMLLGEHQSSMALMHAQLVMVRSAAVVERSAQALFDLLTSPEGTHILDDTTAGNKDPVARLTWRDRCCPSCSGLG